MAPETSATVLTVYPFQQYDYEVVLRTKDFITEQRRDQTKEEQSAFILGSVDKHEARPIHTACGPFRLEVPDDVVAPPQIRHISDDLN